MEYYVYGLYDPITNDPFYMGKGSGERAYSHLKVADPINVLKRAKIESLEKDGLTPIIQILHEGLSDSDAYKLETQYIKMHGRMAFERGGLLTNISNGGPVSRLQNKQAIKKALKLLAHDDEHFKALSILLEDQGKRTRQAIQMDAALKDRLDEICSNHGWKAGTVVKRLVERFVNGEFSGSLQDVIRVTATKENE